MTSSAGQCLICNATTTFVGKKRGVRTDREFEIQRCPECGFAFVADPWTEYAKIYDEAYYAGKGSDPLVDYAFEYENPDRTIRLYEWRGLQQVVSTLAPQARRWLDYGCGNGALVREVQKSGRFEIEGFDTGAWAEKARSGGLPILREDELPSKAGVYDVITAIEVIEHVTDPIGFLTEVRKLARPGALLFLTTLNASNAPANFVDWPYVIPEIHVSFFTSKAMSTALEKSGFEPQFPGMVRGWDQVIRFKVLKNLGFRKTQFWERFVPWRMLANPIGTRYGYSALPIGIAR